MRLKLRQIAAIFLVLTLLAGSSAATQPDGSAQDAPVLPDSSAVVDEPEQTQVTPDAGESTEQSDETGDLPDGESGAEDEPTDEYMDKKIRVGLAYAGNSRGTLVEAKLLISEGNPYAFRFGYYDNELNFVPLGWVENIRDISVVKKHDDHITITFERSFNGFVLLLQKKN